MNCKYTPPLLAAVCGALILSGTTRAMAGADENSAAEEKIVTEVSVRTGKITTATLHGYVSAYGSIETAPATADQPAAGAQLGAPSAGVVTKVDVIEGQHVEKGDALVELNSAAAAAEVERQKTLYAQQNTSLKSLQDAEAQLALLRISAPVAGTVVRINVQPGQSVDMSTVVAEVMDLNRLAVSAEIPSAEAGDLKPGDPVEVSARLPVMTRLLFVSPHVNRDNDTVLVRALLPGAGGLRPGQFVSLRIVTAVHAHCLAAPVESVVTDEHGQSVIALVNGSEATRLPVQTGLRENGLVEVAAPGLQAGQGVVTVGAYGLPEKTRIRLVEASGDLSASTNSAAAK